ncbi:hypothetical protein ALC53_01287 [Atta colombica]|uniref:Uncharacterized protein n=1 Tax=Atta colombica TaxID=520822 RepID=A0A195BUD3_9HYME|nr:hypothetical protein ALC53_01287 [Atta colombica]
MARGHSRMSLSDDERKRIKEIQEKKMPYNLNSRNERLVIRGFTGRKLRFKLSPFLFLVYHKPEVVASPPPSPPPPPPPSPPLSSHPSVTIASPPPTDSLRISARIAFSLRQRASFYSPSSPTPFQLYSRLAEVSL